MAPHGAPDNDGRLKEGCDYLAQIAWNDSLRQYVDPRVKGMPHYTGNAGPRGKREHEPESHIEAAVRMRMGIGIPQTQWKQSQLQTSWGSAKVP